MLSQEAIHNVYPVDNPGHKRRLLSIIEAWEYETSRRDAKLLRRIRNARKGKSAK